MNHGVRGTGEFREGTALSAMEPSEVSADQAVAFLGEAESWEDEGVFAGEFERAAYLETLRQLEMKCKQGLYEKTCPDCKLSRGALRPHRHLNPADTSKAVLSIDLTGPHAASLEGFKYALVGVYTLNSGETLQYAMGLKRKTAEEAATATIQILARLHSLGAPPLVRIHSDNGGEFTGKKFQEMTSRLGLWQTFSAPYHPQANGRAERAVQSIKMGVISLLLHAKMPVKYWFLAMREYTFKQRHRTLVGKIPDDAPTMGDLVMFKPEKTEDWEPRAEKGQFVCNDDRCPNGAMVLVWRNGREHLVRTYCPRLLDWPRQRWKVHRSEENDSAVWVSSSGTLPLKRIS